MLGEQAITDPLPVRVELRQRGEPTRGVLEWWTESGLRYSLPVELPAGTRKVVYLGLPLNAWSLPHASDTTRLQLPQLLWRSEHGEFQLLDVPFNLSQCLPVVVIGDVLGGFEMWRQASFDLGYRFAGTPVRGGEWSLQPIYWSPAAVPDRHIPLLGVPVIILTEGCERLTGEQWDALLAWLLAGGHLIVSVGSIGVPISGTPLAPLLPPMGRRELVQLPAISTPVALIRSRGWADSMGVIRSGSALLACSRRVGRGTLTLFWGDLTASQWRQGAMATPLLNQWSAALRLPAIQTLSAPRPLRPSLEKSQVISAALLFALYWLALYLSWRILRRRRRLILAPIALLLLTGLTWLALQPLVPPGADRVSGYKTTLLLAENRLPLMLEVSDYQLLLPSGEYRWRGEAEVYLLRAQQRGMLDSRGQIVYGADLQLWLQSVGMSELRLQSIRLLKLPAPFEIRVQAGHYQGRNPLPYPLYQVRLWRAKRGTRGGLFHLQNEVLANGLIEAQPRATAAVSDGLPHEGEWLWATLYDMPASLSIPDAEKGVCALWVRIR
jgi:hypothetical protein